MTKGLGYLNNEMKIKQKNKMLLGKKEKCMNKQEFIEELLEIANEDPTFAEGKMDEIIYMIDDHVFFGGYEDGIRGIDHDILKFATNSWENIIKWGTIVVPELKTYISDNEVTLLNNNGYNRVPTGESHYNK